MTDTLAPPVVLDEPGIYTLPDEIYHSDPFKGGSLSSSGARKLLDCPAKYYWDLTHPAPYKAEFEFGHAAHAEVLGVGAPIEVCYFDDWRTNAAKAQRDEAREKGCTPLLEKDWEIVEAMADALRAHPLASRLLAADNGTAEQSLFWRDGRTGVTLRARIDWLPEVVAGRRLIIADYKTARSAEKGAFARAAAEYGYHSQADWYIDGVRSLLGVADPAFVNIVQEKMPPFVVNVIQLDEEAIAIGHDRNRRAIDRYVECTTSGVWPGYSTEVELAALPKWAIYEHQDEFGNEAF